MDNDQGAVLLGSRGVLAASACMATAGNQSKKATLTKTENGGSCKKRKQSKLPKPIYTYTLNPKTLKPCNPKSLQSKNFEPKKERVGERAGLII